MTHSQKSQKHLRWYARGIKALNDGKEIFIIRELLLRLPLEVEDILEVIQLPNHPVPDLAAQDGGCW